MPIAEADIKKTAFRAGLPGLCEFTHMLFRLSNPESSFYCLIEMCLGDWQVVTLLSYIDDICIFAANIDEMLDYTEVDFSSLKEFNLKIKAKMFHFFQCILVFWRYTIKYPPKIEKVKNWPVLPKWEDLHSFWGWHPITTGLHLTWLQSLNSCIN